MNYRAAHLPLHWQEWVNKQEHLSKGKCDPRFNGEVHINFEDGSLVSWKYAFYVLNTEKQEVAVFTEHNGYHVYNHRGVQNLRGGGWQKERNMGIDYNVYIGAYLTVKKGATKKVEWEENVCVNEGCSLKGKAVQDNIKFCPKCGTAIKTVAREAQEEIDAHEFCEEHDIIGVVFPTEEKVILPGGKEDEETQVFTPNFKSGSRGGQSFDPKYEQGVFDLSNTYPAAEIAEVKEKCAKAIKLLEEAYGNSVQVKWGAISSAS